MIVTSTATLNDGKLIFKTSFDGESAHKRLIPPWLQFPGLDPQRKTGVESEDEEGSEGNRKRQEQDEPSAFMLPTARTLYFICTFAFICIQLKARHSNCGVVLPVCGCLGAGL